MKHARQTIGLGLVLAAVSLSACVETGRSRWGGVEYGAAPTLEVTQHTSARDVYMIGRKYEAGEGVVRDVALAAELYEEAYRRGFAPASERLAILAARGEIEEDPVVVLDRLNAAYLRDRAGGSMVLARVLLESPNRTEADVDRALGILRELVADGDLSARLELARAYSDPLLGRSDYAQAEQLYQAVYEAGESRAALEMARMYADATTPVYSPDRSRQWAMVAAAAGEPRGWLVIGRGLSDPALPSYDPAQAENAFRGAVSGGVPGAERDLALFLTAQGRTGEAWQMYQALLASSDDPAVAYDAARLIDDNGVADRSQAYPLYLTSLDSGQTSAVPRILRLLEDDVGSVDMQATALGAVARYAEREQDPDYLGRVGYLYLQGRGGGSSTLAVDYLQRAVDLGNVQAAGRAARLFRDGAPGVAPNPAAAARFFQIAASAGDTGALVNLGRMQEETGAVDAAAATYLRALNAGVPDAAARVYRLVRDNPGVSVDLAPVIAGLETAAASGDADAMVTLGDIAAEPPSGTPSYSDALAWYRKAADAGLAVAFRRLGDVASASLAGLTPDMALNYYEEALARGDSSAGLRVARTLLQATPDGAQVTRAVELTRGPAQAGELQGIFWYGVAQRFAGNYAESLDWLIRAHQAGEEQALAQIVTTASEGSSQGGLDIEAQFAPYLSQGSACDRAVWYTMLGDLAARGAGPQTAAADYYLEAMQLGDANAAAAMGRLQVTGIGLEEPDLAAAQVYMVMASEAGVPGVADKLANLDAVMSGDERARVSDIESALRSQMESTCQ